MAKSEQFAWQQSAACKGAPSYLFFPSERDQPNHKPNPDYIGLTYRDFCANCPVKWVCSEFSDLHDTHGIWGGRTEAERKQANSKVEREEMRNWKANNGLYEPLYGHS